MPLLSNRNLIGEDARSHISGGKTLHRRWALDFTSSARTNDLL
jgi:hypothetical protein